MNREVIEIINSCLVGLPFIDKIAGLSEVQSVKDHKLPFELCGAKDECTTDNSLAPSDKYKSILYWKDRGGVKQVSKSACFLHEYTTDVRLMFWFNHKKFGYDECISSKIISNINSVLADRRCINTDLEDYMNISIEDVSEVSNSSNIFSDYDYNKVCAGKLFKDPYEYFALDMKIRFFYSYQCEGLLTIQPEIIC